MQCSNPRIKAGFTIIELMVATVIFAIIMVVLLQIIGGIGEIWKSGYGKISAFQSARSAFGTINRTLARATLNTYNDYVDASGAYRTIANRSTFAPVRFRRASELHFLCGPTAQLLPGANPQDNPGDSIFFQAPLGDTNENELTSLNRALNSTGFYLQYGVPDDSLVPEWLRPLFHSNKRFLLVQVVEPTENLSIYESTRKPNYNLDWIDAFRTPPTSGQPRIRVLAEDIPLLLFRPRLSPESESALSAKWGRTYDENSIGAVLAPNYQYDSRVWQAGYPSGQRVLEVSPLERVELMRNQVPPIVDVVMVSVDRRSLARFEQTSGVPPQELKVPPGLFTDASKMEEDLEVYGRQLSEAGIRFRIFQTSVEIQGANWSDG